MFFYYAYEVTTVYDLNRDKNAFDRFRMFFLDNQQG